jgi:hypothetical protein
MVYNYSHFAMLPQYYHITNTSQKMTNVIGKRAGTASEWALPSGNASHNKFIIIQRANMPPIRNKNLSNSQEQEGRLLLAISNLQNQKISTIRQAAKIYNIPQTTLQHRL